ncbi:V-type proton ATPase 116 kDa subunit a1-like [Rhagoletis pomonella]|uniref:V-type proton ATPase 116 kDa subunit a1-like n=1 Tax=Rhagoletis pomonella TaxID=28610 RepID=UPI00177FF9BF|nr:V-type proton ATPase 116 kDa subunit a1-like [Rhagoletis pomonella]XP_036344562.1 V-type proton ATPase 116 kDa subunit a1-like [Rhagoletis pomonella]
MGDMFRSEKMALCQLFIQPEAGYTTISELGEIGCVQFRDLNTNVNSFQRRYVSEVRRCDELERQMHYIENELKKDGVVLPELTENPPRAPNPREISDLETTMDRVEMEIRELAQNNVNLKLNYLELTELCMVLDKTQNFFRDVMDTPFHFGDNETQPHVGQGQLGFVAGVLNRERSFAFERMLWRISRGNVFVKRVDLEEPSSDPNTGLQVYKTVFVVFYQGAQLNTRIKKVCNGFRSSLYPCPAERAEREEMLRGVKTRLEDLKLVMSQTADHRRLVLSNTIKNLPRWIIMVKKMKAIYHTLNMCNVDVTKKCLIAEGWVPRKDLTNVTEALAVGSAAVGSTVPSFLNELETQKSPPTFNRVNKFTDGFQHLIDAYGMADYREVNPALYTCITFPFLFAVMFGDLGHGFCIFLFALWMVLDEQRLSKKRGGEIWRIFFGGRYIILLLGLFSMYTGFLYNDIFSKSLNVFGSTWRVRYNRSTVLENPNLVLDPAVASFGVYPLGVDPIWQLADNKIIFLNSLKMKMSIILGVAHMIFGVCLSVVNFMHFKKYALIFLEFLPQILFLILLFGYMCFMMFYKWVKYGPKTDYLPDSPGCAPSVLIYFINMMLFSASAQLEGCDEYMFDAQPLLEKVFVVLAVLCIPWILLGKPLYITVVRRLQAKRQHNSPLGKLEAEDGGHHGAVGTDDEEDEPMSEIWIHQAIHMIEYILSTISHTASYLRLWALSLAHAELSEVLWNMVLSEGLKLGGYPSAIALYFIFGAWVLLTIAIMILMEGLSAFLHTLRLHWVEFMSKFYSGAGYAFMPFSFKILLRSDDDD